MLYGTLFCVTSMFMLIHDFIYVHFIFIFKKFRTIFKKFVHFNSMRIE